MQYLHLPLINILYTLPADSQTFQPIISKQLKYKSKYEMLHNWLEL
jgi:hypothetical protein